jgi:hypothetical protein
VRRTGRRHRQQQRAQAGVCGAAVGRGMVAAVAMPRIRGAVSVGAASG